jgi:hypothetical protein
MPASEGPEFWGVHLRDQVRCFAHPPNWIGEVPELRDILVGGQPQPGADVRWPDAQVEGWFPLSMLRVVGQQSRGVAGPWRSRDL